MKRHNGMRPQDVIILLKVLTKSGSDWYMKDIAHELSISASEVTESLNRSVYAGLLADDKKRVMKGNLVEFLVHGLKYVFPQRPGPIVRGMPTAFSAPPLNASIVAESTLVWPFAEGKVRGQSIEPLHEKVPQAACNHAEFYALAAIIDGLRVGKVREVALAEKELRERLL